MVSKMQKELAGSRFKLCPVAMLGKNMRQGGVESSDDKFIFCSIMKTKGGEKLKNMGIMSYTRQGGCFKEKLELLGFPA